MSDTDEVTALKEEIASLHADCRDLVNFIVSARSEISQIRPDDLKKDKIPRAGKELDAIVQATESATDQIMTAAEKIMAAEPGEADIVNDCCMEIFEACSFQDITGQRISKVVSTLEYIETFLAKLTITWGQAKDAPPMDVATDPEDSEAALLNGPALAGEGIDQDYVDDMFSSDSDKTDKKKADPNAAIDQDDIDALFS